MVTESPRTPAPSTQHLSVPLPGGGARQSGETRLLAWRNGRRVEGARTARPSQIRQAPTVGHTARRLQRIDNRGVGDAGPLGWNLQTVWPVLPDPGLISGCSSTMGCPTGTDPVASAVVKFTSAFQSKGTFVNGTPSPLALSLSIGGQELTLNIASASISFDPMAPGSVTNGTIAGVLNTTQLIDGLKNVAGNISTSLCSGSAFDSIALQIEQTSDILLGSDNTTVSNTPGTQCNAISIGLGFNSTEIAPPTAIAPGAPAAPSPCSDGG